MSTATGFFCGVLSAAVVAALYGDQLSGALQFAIEPNPNFAQLSAQPAAAPVHAIEGRQAVASTVDAPAEPDDSVQSDTLAENNSPAATATVEPDLSARWALYAANASRLSATGSFPWQTCFQRAAASYQLPETLLLAIASGESNFDHSARSASEAVGIMQIRWPDTARHLGINREADLYDPCTNVDAGARYISELLERYSNDYHLAVAAYNYGPGRVSAEDIPEGARWYSQYVYRHLQQVLGSGAIAETGTVKRPETSSGSQMLMSFSQPHRARAFINHLKRQLPDLKLQLNNGQLGEYHVVLLFNDIDERRLALRDIDEAGIATLTANESTVRL